MRKAFLLIILILSFFVVSCEQQICSLAVSIDCDNPGNVKYVGLREASYLEVKKNETFYGNYFSMPPQNKFIQVIAVESSKPDIVSVVSVDPLAYRFTLKAVDAGQATINVRSLNCGSGTSLRIIVK